MQIADYLRKSTTQLRKAGIDGPRTDASILAAFALGLERTDLLSQSERFLTTEEMAKIDKLMERRALREPVARIKGAREFWGLDFFLNEATLDPRPDSETLVEAVLAYAKPQTGDLNLLDLGTGSGCLLLALLHDLPQAHGIGIDQSGRALEAARSNAQNLKLAGRAEFRTGNWFEGVQSTFDVILSNPPYIAAAEMPDLAPEVREFDPTTALTDGADGLSCYRHITPLAPQFLKPGGLLIFEVGQNQAQAVATLLRQSGFKGIATHKDLAGIARCVSGKRA